MLARRAVSSKPQVLRVVSFTVTVRGMGVPGVYVMLVAKPVIPALPGDPLFV